MKRFFDMLFAIIILTNFFWLFVLIGLCVRLTSRGPVLHWSRRIGKDNSYFLMPKFRTMFIDAPDLASHLLQNPEKWLTPLGSLLRRTSLDELPQLWSIIIGKMSFVGPRPALFNQHDLVALRTEHGIHKLRPGLTGWAQINGRDELSITQKVKLDFEYMCRQSFLFDLKIIMLSFLKIIGDNKVSH